ncbi:MAG: hypothetical protein FWD64_08515 [Acidobacteriaceae bacterium]|nr:hypothetical protein [Acidobacteriaceae bacterium]
MSRSNHHYYNVCCSPINEDGYCERHEDQNYWHPQRTCITERDVLLRRGVYRRRKRFPSWGIKRWISGPPMDVKRIWRQRARAQQKQEFLRNPEEPLITPMKRLVNLWDWY